MNAKKCDRCGAFYVSTNEGRVFAINKRSFPSNYTLDLCPKCYNDLLTFMANPGVMSVRVKCQKEEKSDVE